MPTGWIIIERPKHCRYCGHNYYGLQPTVEYAIEKGYDVIDLAAYDAIRSKIYEAIRDYNPIFFTGMGHGLECLYTDDSEQAVWECTQYPPDNLAGRIVYLWSCKTGAGLGPSIIEHGAIAYAGYTQNWVWLSESGTSGSPYDDKYARGFFESANELNYALIDGLKFSEAITRCIDKYNEWINYWETEGSSDPYASNAIKWLLHDRDVLIALGDGNATIRLKHCSECTTEEECNANNCYWYNGLCHGAPPKPGDINNEPDCRKYGYYWYDGACHLYPPVDNTFDFTVNVKLASYGYIIGGLQAGAVLTSVEQYYPKMDIWHIIADLTIGRVAPSAFNIQNDLYTAAGSDGRIELSVLEKYHILSDTWTIKTGMDIPRTTAGSFALNRYGYVIGGKLANDLLKTVERYDPASDTWEYKTDISEGKQNMGSFSIGEYGYITSGWKFNIKLYTTEKYDPASDTWSFKADIIHPVTQPGCFTLYEYGYVVSSDYTQVYIPFTDTWSLAQPINIYRQSFAGFDIRGYGYAVGGAKVTSGRYTYLDVTEEYDIDTDSWTTKNNIYTPRMSAAGGKTVEY